MLLNSVHITLFNETQRRLTTVSNIMFFWDWPTQHCGHSIEHGHVFDCQDNRLWVINCRALFEELIMR